ncbi:MAG: hypothetical protein ABEJ40_05310 [Haloarculaceae archaeon]
MPDREETSESTVPIDRRTLLRALGAGSAAALVLGGGAGSAAARGRGSGRRGRGNENGEGGDHGDDDHGRGDDDNHGNGERGVGPCTCEEPCPDGTVCGKVDGSPVEGETYSFPSDGASFSLTVESVTTEDGDPKCFTFTSSDDVERVCVKGGPPVTSYDVAESDYTGSELREFCAPENPNSGKRYGISNVSFCGAADDAVDHFQIDLVRGDPICDLGGSDGKTYGGGRLIRVLAVGEDGTVTQRGTNENTEAASCVENVSEISFDADAREASVSFDVTEDDCPISLAGYRLVDGCTKFDDCPDEPQTLLACDTGTFDDGDEDVRLTVDLDDGSCRACR